MKWMVPDFLPAVFAPKDKPAIPKTVSLHQYRVAYLIKDFAEADVYTTQFSLVNHTVNYKIDKSKQIRQND